MALKSVGNQWGSFHLTKGCKLIKKPIEEGFEIFNSFWDTFKADKNLLDRKSNANQKCKIRNL